MSDLKLNRPSDEAYRKAKEVNGILYNNIAIANERLMGLIDEIVAERTLIASYKESIAHNQKVILTYELFKEREEREDLNAKS